MTDHHITDAQIGYLATRPGDVPVSLKSETAKAMARELLDLRQAVNEWRQARKAVLAEPTPDVRTSDSFRAALDRLASAEDALFNLKGVAP